MRANSPQATLGPCLLAVAVCLVAAGCGRQQSERTASPEPEAGVSADSPASSEPPATGEEPEAPTGPAAPPESAPEKSKPSPPSEHRASEPKKLTEDDFVEIGARILLASEGLPVGEDTRITPEGLQELERRTDEIMAERGFTREQVSAFEESVKGLEDLQRISKRVRTRFAELKQQGGGENPSDEGQ